ncbi:MAG: Pr6Pr family membrane protein [Bacteroidota bacterium]
MSMQKWATPFKIITAITAWAALALQLYIMVDNTPGNGMTPLQAVGRFLIFFTVLTNLLVAISLSIELISPVSAAGRFFAKPSTVAATAFYIFIVGLVYNLILRNLWNPTGLQRIADELLHVAVPLLFTIYWLFIAPKGTLKWKHPFAWLLFPAAYLVYALVRGAAEGFYAYPFINVTELGYTKVFTNCAGLLIVFIIIGFLFVAVDRMVSHQARMK